MGAVLFSRDCAGTESKLLCHVSVRRPLFIIITSKELAMIISSLIIKSASIINAIATESLILLLVGQFCHRLIVGESWFPFCSRVAHSISSV